MSSHLSEVPVFDIEGRKYSFKRLGLHAAKDLLKLAKETWKNGLIDLTIHVEQMKFLLDVEEDEVNEKMSPGLMAFFMIDHCFDKFLELMSNYLVEVKEDGTKESVSFEDLEDAERFPMSALVSMGVFFTVHPDLKMFVAAIEEGKDLPFFQAVLQKVKSLDPTQTTV